MIPASGFVAPPEWVGSTQEKRKKQYVSLCRASQHALHVYIHTHRLYIHIYIILTDKYIHTPIHACTYRHAPPTHRGGRGILYIHTYILTYKYIHAPIHACTYRHAPPTHRGGGAGGRPLVTDQPPLYIQTPVHPYPLVGGGCGACRPGPYIYISTNIYSLILFI